MADQWLVIVAGSKQLEELRRMPDDQVSNYGGVDEVQSLSGSAQSSITDQMNS